MTETKQNLTGDSTKTMDYIIKHDFHQEIPYYVRLVDDKTFEEIYNPNFATRFKTRKDAKDFIDTYSSMERHSKIVDANKAIEHFDEWVKSGMISRTLNCINTSKSRPYNGESLVEVIDWWIYQKHHDDEIKFEHYQTWPGLYRISKHLWEAVAYHSKDYSERYITFELYTKKDGIFEEFETELNLVIDKVTHKVEDGYLVFPVLDHYLSEHGNSVCLLIHPETKKVKIASYYWSSGDEYSSLEEAFNYLKKERYYE
jgi:hypothetical protein